MIIYTSDIHGNEIQYKKVIDYALKTSAEAIIIGGDIAPKDFQIDEYINCQREFIKTKLPELLSPLKDKIKVYLIMGNDDAATNLDVLNNEDSNLYKVIHGKRLNINDNFDIVGYSTVPITPFGIKDWEKFDLSEILDSLANRYANRKLVNYKVDGFKTSKQGFLYFKFNPEMERLDSIQKDLTDELFTTNPKKTVYVFHSPPDDTKLDMIAGGNHVGSMAIRLFIEQFQPYLTLHGHIHETVEISGDFKQTIGDSLCLASGNHNVGEEVSLLVLDLDDIKKVKRITI